VKYLKTFLSLFSFLLFKVDKLLSQSETSYFGNGVSYFYTTSTNVGFSSGLGGYLTQGYNDLNPATGGSNIQFTIYGTGWEWVDVGNPTCQVDWYTDNGNYFYGVATDQSGNGNYQNVSLQPLGYGTVVNNSVNGGWGNGYVNQQLLNTENYYGILLNWNHNVYYGWIQVCSDIGEYDEVWIQSGCMCTNPSQTLLVGSYEAGSTLYPYTASIFAPASKPKINVEDQARVKCDPIDVSIDEVLPGLSNTTKVSILQGSAINIITSSSAGKVNISSSNRGLIKENKIPLRRNNNIITSFTAMGVADDIISVYSQSSLLLHKTNVRIYDLPFGRREINSTFAGKTLNVFRGEVIAFTLPYPQPSNYTWSATLTNSTAASLLVKYGTPLLNPMAQTTELDYYVPKEGSSTITFTLRDNKSNPIRTLSYNIISKSHF